MSTRLTRELIAADARSDQERDDAAARAARLLDAAVAGLSASLGAILHHQPAPASPRCLAAQGVAPAAVELLEGRGGSESLAQRACAERRVFLLDRASRESLMSALRAELPDLATAVVIPLYDRGLAVAALLLGAVDGRLLQPSSLRLLAPAFHLLGVLLSPGRSGSLAGRREAAAEGADHERYLVEIEELGNQLREARESVRLAAERAAADEAERRAEIEGYRARIAELEASASRGDVESSMRADLEAALAARSREVDDRERRIVDLHEELREAESRIATLEEDLRAAQVVRLDGADASDEGSGVAGVRLQEIADAAAAALADGREPDDGDGAADPASDLDGTAVAGASEGLVGAERETGEEGAADDPVPDAAAGDQAYVVRGVFAVESDGEVRTAVAAVAERCGVASWFGAAPSPDGARGLLVANLFDPELGRCAELLASGRAECVGLAYGRDAESQSGVEIGAVTWLPRPIDVAATIARVRAVVPGRVGGVVIISSQLRELAPLREALTGAGVSSSVACDSRQAMDLLDIVRQPDAILIDLALEGGQAVTIAAGCRGQSETRDVPLMLLLPREADPARLSAGAQRAGILGPFGEHEVSRMVTAALSAL